MNKTKRIINLSDYFDSKPSFEKVVYEMIQNKKNGSHNYTLTLKGVSDTSYDSYLQTKLKSYGVACDISRDKEDLTIHYTLDEASNLYIAKSLTQKLESLSPTIGVEKIEDLFLFIILEQEETQQKGGGDIIQFSKKSVDELGIEYTKSGIDLDELDKDAFSGPNITELVLLLLFVKGKLSKIYFPEETQRMVEVVTDYAIVISEDFRNKDLLQVVKIDNDLLQFAPNIKSIEIVREKKGFALLRTHVFYGNENKYVDLQKRFPFSKITSNVYYGKSFKYIVQEKVLLKEFDNTKE